MIREKDCKRFCYIDENWCPQDVVPGLDTKLQMELCTNCLTFQILQIIKDIQKMLKDKA